MSKIRNCEQCLKLKNNAKLNFSNFDGLFVRYSMVMVSNKISFVTVKLYPQLKQPFCFDFASYVRTDTLNDLLAHVLLAHELHEFSCQV